LNLTVVKKTENRKTPPFWCELHIVPPDGWAEAVAGYLFEVGAEAVEERHDKGKIALVTHFPHDNTLNDRLALLGAYLAEVARISGAKKLPKITVRKIENRAWAAEARRSFRPVEIVTGVRVVPSWKKIRKKPGERVVVIDPGEAFGTGLHSSTRLSAKLMVEAMSRYESPRVLDVGTGTGILAMVALVKGAGDVTANDSDPKALEVAASNFRNNAFAVKLTGTGIEKMRKKFHIVVANILLEELDRLAPYLLRRTLDGGIVILSGLLTSQAEQMRSRMSKLGIRKTWRETRRKSWIAMGFVKP